MSTKDKKGGKKTKPKIGITEETPKIPKYKKDFSSAKSSPVKLHTETVGAKLKVVPPVSSPKNGAENARKNRLKKAGVEIDCCPVTGLSLDIGPRANEWLKPTEFKGQIMSWLARIILESEITPEELRKVAELLKKH